jgi:hypothetical protein
LIRTVKYKPTCFPFYPEPIWISFPISSFTLALSLDFCFQQKSQLLTITVRTGCQYPVGSYPNQIMCSSIPEQCPLLISLHHYSGNKPAVYSVLFWQYWGLNSGLMPGSLVLLPLQPLSSPKPVVQTM